MNNKIKMMSDKIEKFKNEAARGSFEKEFIEMVKKINLMKKFNVT